MRGLAILAVIAFHTTTVATAGWMGVDLFFVLSGFLITGILLDARRSASYFRTFYARRILRIVPVYVAFLLVCLALGLLAEQGWYWSYLVNVWLTLHGWQDGPTHLWSLAVEEQFYLAWPLAVWLLPPRTLPRVALGAIVVAELCRVALIVVHAPPQANYLLLPTRMDTLAVGAYLACVARGTARIPRWPVVAAAVVALLAARGLAHAWDYERPAMQLLGYPAIAVLSGALVWNNRWFANPVLRFFGRYSYGMYVWHWLVLRYVHGALPALAVTTAVALLSWYALEQPVLRLKRFFSYEGAPRRRKRRRVML